MADYPYLPLWTDAYLADTRSLTQAQHGAYLLLMMTAWRTSDCSLPNDDHQLARFACTDTRNWQKQKPVVMAFWTLGDDGRWRQKRLSAERGYLAQRAEKRAKAGRSGGQASAAIRASKGEAISLAVTDNYPFPVTENAPCGPHHNQLKNKDNGQANVDFCSSKIQAPTPTPTPTYTEGDKSPSADAAAPVIEDLFYDGEPDPEPVPGKTRNKALFDRGTEVLGKKTGGMVSNLLKHVGQDYDRADTLMELAATKADPRQWLGAVLRGDASARADVVIAETDRLYASWGVQ